MEKRKKNNGLRLMAAMAGLTSGMYGMNPMHKSNPYYFEYSGISSEEQILKREKRKARKKLAKKLAK